VPASGDDGKPHCTWEFTDWGLFDHDTGVVDDARAQFWRTVARPDMCRKIMIGKELAPETAHWHAQIRVSFNRNYRHSQLLKLFPPMHWEVTKCPHDWLYYAKWGTELWLDVDNRQQGRRNVFKEQLDLVKSGVSVRDCALLDGANYQSIRSAEELVKYFEPERPTAPRAVTLLTDPAQAPPGCFCVQNRHWDGYDRHDAVLINNSVCKFSIPELLQVSGSAPFRVGRGRQAVHSSTYFVNLDYQERRAVISSKSVLSRVVNSTVFDKVPVTPCL